MSPLTPRSVIVALPADATIATFNNIRPKIVNAASPVCGAAASYGLRGKPRLGNRRFGFRTVMECGHRRKVRQLVRRCRVRMHRSRCRAERLGYDAVAERGLRTTALAL